MGRCILALGIMRYMIKYNTRLMTLLREGTSDQVLFLSTPPALPRADISHCWSHPRVY